MSRQMRNSGLRRAVEACAYPTVMALGLALHGGLTAAGLPAQAAAYLAVAAAALPILLHERWLPYRAEWRPERAEMAIDAAFLVLVQMLLPVALALTLVVALSDLLRAQDWRPEGLWPADWPVPAQAALMLLAADLPRYWLHRAFHRVPALWRLHAVHHSPAGLYWLNVGRFHPLEKAIQYLVDALPFALIGVAEPVLALYFVFYAINGFFQHSNCAVRLGPLNWLVSGPELHRWHHSRLPEESDSNFGNNLIVWDVLFGTRRLPRGREVGPLGLREPDYPRGFLAQLAAPFRRTAAGATS